MDGSRVNGSCQNEWLSQCGRLSQSGRLSQRGRLSSFSSQLDGSKWTVQFQLDGASQNGQPWHKGGHESNSKVDGR